MSDVKCARMLLSVGAHIKGKGRAFTAKLGQLWQTGDLTSGLNITSGRSDSEDNKSI